MQVDDLLSDDSDSDETFVGEANTAVDFLLVNSDSDSDSEAVHIPHTTTIPATQIARQESKLSSFGSVRKGNPHTDVLSDHPTSTSSNISSVVPPDPNPIASQTARDASPFKDCKQDVHKAPVVESDSTLFPPHCDDTLLKVKPLDTSATDSGDTVLTPQEHPEPSKSADASSNVSNGSGSQRSSKKSVQTIADDDHTQQLSRMDDSVYHGNHFLQPTHATPPGVQRAYLGIVCWKVDFCKFNLEFRDDGHLSR